jgi:DnaJ-class molecular chaperone
MCKECSGKKVVKEAKIVEVHIDKGVSNGHKITFSGMSDEKPGCETGDLLFIVQIADHSLFKRRGADLLIEQDISLSEALCGFAIPIKHLDDRTIVVTSNRGEIIKPGDIKLINEEGMPIHQNPFQKGRLFVHFKVVFPEKGQLTLDAIAALDATLPRSERPKLHTGDAEPEVVSLVEADVDSFGKYGASADKDAYDSDEEGGGGRGGGPGVQCAQQ